MDVTGVSTESSQQRESCDVGDRSWLECFDKARKSGTFGNEPKYRRPTATSSPGRMRRASTESTDGFSSIEKRTAAFRLERNSNVSIRSTDPRLVTTAYTNYHYDSRSPLRPATSAFIHFNLCSDNVDAKIHKSFTWKFLNIDLHFSVFLKYEFKTWITNIIRTFYILLCRKKLCYR